jgi:hypothetical protein
MPGTSPNRSDILMLVLRVFESFSVDTWLMICSITVATSLQPFVYHATRHKEFVIRVELLESWYSSSPVSYTNCKLTRSAFRIPFQPKCLRLNAYLCSTGRSRKRLFNIVIKKSQFGLHWPVRIPQQQILLNSTKTHAVYLPA